MRPALLLLLGCSDYELAGHKPAASPGEEPEPAACAAEADPSGVVAVDPSCALVLEPAGGAPTVEWQWSSAVATAGYDDVMVMPAVGDVDGDGMPEVVVTAYTGRAYTSAGVLTILSGDGAGEEASFADIGGYAPYGTSGVALGDLDGDGVVEILVHSTDSRLLALHADGTLVWASEARVDDIGRSGYPAIADLNGDGAAEAISGRVILGANGAILGIGAHGIGGAKGIPVVADLDLDGQQEVIVGNAAYRMDGSDLYTNTLPDGWPAVADFDGNGLGDVVVVDNGQVWLTGHDGALRWGPVELPGGGGGPPTVADFDNDGAPEIGVAGKTAYTVFDTDGSVLWQQPTTDASSSRTGSSVFDFEGDGAAEVVYADELVLWVYDGATGAPLVAEEGHSSWTLYEYPVIVDVDGDDDAEIVLISNDSQDPGWQGVTVLGAGAADAWAPTTPTWNQHAYAITNVNDNLSIPAHPTMNWLSGHNNFRAGGLRERPGIPLGDLLPLLDDACWDCPTETTAGAVELALRIGNQGTGPSTATGYAVYSVDKAGLTVRLGREALPALASGEATAPAILRYTLGDLSQIDHIFVRADDDGSGGAGPTEGLFAECDEDNNVVELRPPACP